MLLATSRAVLCFLTLSVVCQAQLAQPAFQIRRPSDLDRSGYGGALDRIRGWIITAIWGTSTCYWEKKPWLARADDERLMSKYADEFVIRFNISTAEEANALAETTNTLFLDVWEFNSEFADIRVSRETLPSLLRLLPGSLRNAHSILIPDLNRLVYESYPGAKNESLPSGAGRYSRALNWRQQSSSTDSGYFFRDYQPLSVIRPWMRLVQGLFPTHVRLISIGTTYEGRDILAFRVGVHPGNSEGPPKSRKHIIVSGGSHAREWISTAAVSYAAFSLISAYGKSREMTKLIEEFDWIFIPTLNPDGYVYTWESDRLWRKNRQQTDLRFCKGIDLDRSFSFQWDGESTRGNPCSESFAGNMPMEAVEAQGFANWMKNESKVNNAKFVGFLDFHSYSQQILYPFSFSCIQTPPTLENLEELGLGLAKAIKQANGKNYGVTSACEGGVSASTRSKEERAAWPRIESGGGSALDFMYHEMIVRYSYQIKLRDTGSYGFLLPSKNIVPSGKEVFNALTYFGHYLLGNKGIESIENSPSSEGKVVLKKPYDSQENLVLTGEEMDEEDNAAGSIEL